MDTIRKKIKQPRLTQYQRDFLEDPSLRIIALKSRQIGFSDAAALKVVNECHETPETGWLLASAGMRQAKELMRKVKRHIKVINAIARFYEEETIVDDQKISVEAVEFKNDSRIISVPANEDTIRSFSENVLLDEFGFHRNGKAIWSALAPAAATFGKKIIILSTPNGAQGMFYDLWTKNDSFKKYKVTIEDAVAQGFPIDIEQIKKDFADVPEAYEQEFMCIFLDGSMLWIPMELITDATAQWEIPIFRHENIRESEAGQIVEQINLNKLTEKVKGNLYLGVDFARTTHLTALWVSEAVDGRLVTRWIIELRNAEFEAQKKIIEAHKPHITRGCLDATAGSLGMPISEYFVKRYPGKFEGVNFNTQTKIHLATQLKTIYERRKAVIPDDVSVRYDIHSIKRQITPTGNVRLAAVNESENKNIQDKKSHGDRFWAQALCAEAASGAVMTYEVEHLKQSRWKESRNYL